MTGVEDLMDGSQFVCACVVPLLSTLCVCCEGGQEAEG